MNRVTDVIRGRFANMLDRHLSARTKRLLFLASFSAQLKDPKEINSEMLRKLNQMLELSSDDAALKLPMQLSHAIWRNRPLEPGLRLSLRTQTLPGAASSIGLKVIKAMPKWMRYGDDKRMQTDVEQLLRNWQRVGA
jgi:hypothetical protein